MPRMPILRIIYSKVAESLFQKVADSQIMYLGYTKDLEYTLNLFSIVNNSFTCIHYPSIFDQPVLKTDT